MSRQILIEHGWQEQIPDRLRDVMGMAGFCNSPDASRVVSWLRTDEVAHEGNSRIMPGEPSRTVDLAVDSEIRHLYELDNPGMEACVAFVNFAPYPPESAEPTEHMRATAPTIDEAVTEFRRLVTRSMNPVDGVGLCQWATIRIIPECVSGRPAAEVVASVPAW